MARDLDDVIRRSLDERAERLEGAAPDPDAFAAVVAGVRRRRRRRQVDRAFAGVGVVAVLAVAVMLGGGHGAPAPAHTPSPSASSSTTATPTPSPTPTPSASPTAPPRPAQAEIDAGLGLPATVPAPDGIWDQVGAGWVLGIYRPSWAQDGFREPLRNTVVLTSPTGTAYRVLELRFDAEVQLVRWSSGTTRALVTIAPVHADGVVSQKVRGWLDLRSGALTQDPGAVGAPASDGFPPELSYFAVDHRGDEVWFVTYGQTGGGGPATMVVEKPDGTLVRRIDLAGDWPRWSEAMLSPDGRRVVLPGHDSAGDAGSYTSFDVVDLDTGREDAHAYGVPGRFCTLIGWASASELLTRCGTQPWDATGQWERLNTPGDPWYRVGLDGRAPRQVRTLAEGDPGDVVTGAGTTTLGGRLVVGAIPIGLGDAGRCEARLYAVDRTGEATAVAFGDVGWARPSGTLGGRVYVETNVGCEETDTVRTQLESFDGANRTTLLGPATSRDPLIGDALNSWAVAGGPSGRPGP